MEQASGNVEKRRDETRAENLVRKRRVEETTEDESRGERRVERREE
jgi:hypothetical protein